MILASAHGIEPTASPTENCRLLQAFLDAGQHVILDTPGTYRVDRGLTVERGRPFRLTGGVGCGSNNEAGGTVLRLVDGAEADAILTIGASGPIANTTPVVVEHIDFRADGQLRTVDGVVIRQGTQAQIAHCRAIGLRTGFKAAYSARLIGPTFSHDYTYGCEVGFELDGMGGQSVNTTCGARIESCESDTPPDCNRIGFWIHDYGRGFHLDSCVAHAAGEACLLVEHSRGVITNSYFERISQSGTTARSAVFHRAAVEFIGGVMNYPEVDEDSQVWVTQQTSLGSWHFTRPTVLGRQSDSLDESDHIWGPPVGPYRKQKRGSAGGFTSQCGSLWKDPQGIVWRDHHGGTQKYQQWMPADGRAHIPITDQTKVCQPRKPWTGDTAWYVKRPWLLRKITPLSIEADIAPYKLLIGTPALPDLYGVFEVAESGEMVWTPGDMPGLNMRTVDSATWMISCDTTQHPVKSGKLVVMFEGVLV